MKRIVLGRVIFRFRAMAILAVLAVALTVAALGVAADGGGDKNRDWGREQAPPIPQKAKLKYPNLGSHLDHLVARVEDGEMSKGEATGDAAIHREELIAVTVHLSGYVDDVVSFLADKGGDPRNAGEDYIEAYVPMSLLGPVSEQPGVIRVREIVPPQPVQITQTVAGNGPAVHGSLAWNRAGYSGHGVKVGIIDDFKGLSSLMGTELPTTVHGMCYTDIGVFTNNLADCETVSEVSVGIPDCLDYAQNVAVRNAEHGTIVAESVFDIAPEASLYIANPRSKGDLQDAVKWMASQGVQVINYSVGWTFDGPGDGTSPSSASPLRAVDRAVSSDIIWVNSAGNSADMTWFGGYSNPDGDGLLGFDGQNDEAIGISVRACRTYRVQLRWEDSWYGASTDLNLYLYDTRTREYISTIYSAEEQSGKSGHVPYETIVFRAAVDSNDLGIVVEHYGGGVPDWIQLMVWGQGAIQHYTANGSILNPSESANPGMLAVGAAHWNDVRNIEYYSSRGPTPDGRVKPDVVGADCGATSLRPLNEYNSGFCGTSQAAPHIAGLAALVRQRFPSYTPTQVAAYLKDNAEQRRSPAPNDTWGHGFVKLPSPDGAPTIAPAPANTFARNPAADFNTLATVGNRGPRGIWSDGATMWVADWFDKKIYAYDMATRVRAPGMDFDTLKAAENIGPTGIWSDGATMWVVDWFDKKIYAYDMATKARAPGMDFDTLKAAENIGPTGIWSDGATMWVADRFDKKIYAYDMATRARSPDMDFDTLKSARNISPRGIWSDGTTMWVADSLTYKVYAYDMATKGRTPDMEFNTLEAAGNWGSTGIWSDGTTTWVADSLTYKVYAYGKAQVESASDRAALVALYNSTGGANWTRKDGWLTDTPIGQWHGVTTDTSGRVTVLDLTNNQLTGQIPPQLGNFARLKLLSLSDNQLSGTIPTELGSLANLKVLYLSANQLTGEIPTELGRLTNLTALHLSGNHLTGCVPASLRDVADDDFAQLGLPFCTPGDPLIARYDVDSNGTIEKSELIVAINDYLFGMGNDAIGKEDIIKV